MIAITPDIQKDIISAYKRLGRAEFNRITEFTGKGNLTIYDYFKRNKTISKKMADRLSQIVDLDRYSEASHFKVCTVEDIERYSDLPVMQYYDDEKEALNIYHELAKSFISKLDEMIYLMLKHSPKDCTIWGLAFAIGSKHLSGRSMTQVAKDIGVTKAAISKHARYLIDVLNLPTSPYMKSEDSIESYRQSALNYHKRKREEGE
jgi:hypothetical protein